MLTDEYQINVTVHEARGLQGKDSNHMSDPMCLVQVGPEGNLKRWTETKSDQINVVWEARFTFNSICLTPAQFAREKVSFKVYDKKLLYRRRLDWLVGVYAEQHSSPEAAQILSTLANAV